MTKLPGRQATTAETWPWRVQGFEFPDRTKFYVGRTLIGWYEKGALQLYRLRIQEPKIEHDTREPKVLARITGIAKDCS